MTPQELYEYALSCKEENGAYLGMTLVGKMPRGFPRGELLSEGPRGPVRSYDPDKVIAWLVKNKLVDTQPLTD
jgi:hypothetical protein